jgi:N-acetylneuraminic acid mutarotase
MTSMITAAYHIDGAAIDGNIYIPGGETSASVRNAFVQVYSTAADTWSTVEPLPVPLRYHEVVAHDGLLYVLGGETTGDVYSADVFIYNPATDAWTAGTPMPIAVGYAASGVIDGKIYVAGGYNGAYQTALQIYDPATDTWASGADLPHGWVQAADGVKDDRYMILAGGYYDSLFAASIFALVYDAVNDRWTFLPTANSLRYGAAGAVDGSEFYYIAGREYAGTFFYSNRNEHLIQCLVPTPDNFPIYLPMVTR